MLPRILTAATRIKESVPAWRSALESLKRIIVSLSTIAGGVLFIGFMKNSIFESETSIDPIKIPDSFAQRGFTPEIATTLMLDEVAKIREISTANLRSKSIKTKLPGEELSKLQSHPIAGGIDIHTIKTLIQTSLGIRHEKISSEITISERNGSRIYHIRMRSNLDQKLMVDFDTDKDLPEALKETAIKLVEKLDPVAASSYYRWQRDFKSAFKLIDEALRNDDPQDDLYALNNRASMYVQLKKFDLAQADLNQVFQLNPEFPWSINVQSYLLNEKGQFSEGLPWALKAQKLLQDKWQPFANAGDSYKGMKDIENAKKQYQLALDRNPTWSLQYLELIDFYSSVKDASGLETTFTKAIRKFPRHPEILLKYSQHLQQKEHLEQAANYLEVAYREAPDNREIWSAYLALSGHKNKLIEAEMLTKLKTKPN